HVRERAVAVVVVELAGVPVARRGLVAHEQVEPAVAVVIEPGRGLGGREPQQPRRAGHVHERAVARVAQEGQREASLGAQPPAAPAGRVPGAMGAPLSTRRAPRFPGPRARTPGRAWTARVEPSRRWWTPPPRIGARQASRLLARWQFWSSAMRMSATASSMRA